MATYSFRVSYQCVMTLATSYSIAFLIKLLVNNKLERMWWKQRCYNLRYFGSMEGTEKNCRIMSR